jgi:uncharacterized protein (DUF2132 family)
MSPSFNSAVNVSSSLKTSFFVEDKVTSLKFLRFLKDKIEKIETPYVVSYFFNRLSRAAARRLHLANEIAPRGILKRHKPLHLAAKHQNHNDDDEKEADRASANPDGTGKNRR